MPLRSVKSVSANYTRTGSCRKRFRETGANRHSKAQRQTPVVKWFAETHTTSPPYLGDPKFASDVSNPLGYVRFAMSGNRSCMAPFSTMNRASTPVQRQRLARRATEHHLSSMAPSLSYAEILHTCGDATASRHIAGVPEVELSCCSHVGVLIHVRFLASFKPSPKPWPSSALCVDSRLGGSLLLLVSIAPRAASLDPIRGTPFESGAVLPTGALSQANGHACAPQLTPEASGTVSIATRARTGP